MMEIYVDESKVSTVGLYVMCAAEIELYQCSSGKGRIQSTLFDKKCKPASHQSPWSACR